MHCCIKIIHPSSSLSLLSPSLSFPLFPSLSLSIPSPSTHVFSMDVSYPLSSLEDVGPSDVDPVVHKQAMKLLMSALE